MSTDNEGKLKSRNKFAGVTLCPSDSTGVEV